MNSKKNNLTDQIMLLCDENLDRLTEEVMKKHNLNFENAREIIDKCFVRLCCTCWMKEEKNEI